MIWRPWAEIARRRFRHLSLRGDDLPNVASAIDDSRQLSCLARYDAAIFAVQDILHLCVSDLTVI